MASTSVALCLQFTRKFITSPLPLAHNSRTSEHQKKKKKQESVQARLADSCEPGRDGEGPYGVQRESSFEFNLGRRTLASAAAALLIQCTCSGDLAIASTYSPSAIEVHSSSILNFGADHCVAAPTFTASAKKSRTGIHLKPGTQMDGSSKQGSLTAGLRKPALLVKRSGSYFPQLRNSLLARQLACSTVGVLPISPLWAASFANSLSGLGLALDLSIFRSSFGTSINLLSLCALVVWMQRSGQLPSDTPVILSQVAFRLFIPCFLMSKVATTLTGSSASNLVALPLMALAQVIIGAGLGKTACKVFFKLPSFQPAVDWSSNEAVESSSSLAFKEHQQKLSRAAMKKQALITAACAFGNSLTLPLVFLSGVLTNSEDANRAAGYLAFYMVGWSPAMWSVGYRILSAGDEKEEVEWSSEQTTWQAAMRWIGSFMNPPLYGVLVGLLIGGTPLSHLFLGGKEGAVLASTSVAFDTVGTFARLRTVTAGILSPLFEAASLLGTATLAVQTVVLATSLGAVPTESQQNISSLGEDSQNSGGTEISLYKSEVVLDTKAFWIISLVRPGVIAFNRHLALFVLQCFHLLPADPIYRLVILAESAMPTAQNLVLLAQLNAGTRPLAGMLAELLLREYALSMLPITMWMAVFLSVTPVA